MIYQNKTKAWYGLVKLEWCMIRPPMIYQVNVHNFHSEFVDQYLLDQHGKTNLITHGTGKNPLFGIKLFFWGVVWWKIITGLLPGFIVQVLYKHHKLDKVPRPWSVWH